MSSSDSTVLPENYSSGPLGLGMDRLKEYKQNIKN